MEQAKATHQNANKIQQILKNSYKTNENGSKSSLNASRSGIRNTTAETHLG